MKKWHNTTLARIVIPIFLIGGAISLLSEKFIETMFERQISESVHKEMETIIDRFYNVAKNRYEILFFNHGDKKENFLALEDAVKEETIRDLKSISKTQPYAFYIYNTKEFIPICKKTKDFNFSQLDLTNKDGFLNDNRYVIKDFLPWSWKLIVINDNSMLNNIIAANKKVIALVVFVVALLISIVIFVVLHRTLNAPFKKIFDHLDNIKNGEYKNLEPIPNSSEEIKSLVSHINNMSNELQAKALEEQRLIDKLDEERLYAKKILDSQTSIVIVTNGNRIIDCNKPFLEFFNKYKTLDEFRKYYDCVCDFFESYDDGEQKYLERREYDWVKKATGMEQKALILKDGQKRHFGVNAKRFLHNQEVIYIVTLDDITALVTKKEELKKRLYTDDLTKLPNRQKLLLDMVGTDSPVLFLINIDSFSEINDLYGYRVGDELLALLSKKLQKSISLFKKLYTFNRAPHDWTLYKLAGDEYAFLMPEAPTKEEQEKIAYSMCHLIENSHFWCQGVDIEIKVTIGVSDSDKIMLDDWEKPKNILSDADMALKKAKDEGRSYLFYSDDMNLKRNYINNIEYAKKLKNGIFEDRIVPYFQPIMDTITGKITKYETLIRLIDENGKVIGPMEFLEVAKSSKQYEKLTRIVIQKSFEFFADKPYEFSINLSYEDISNSDTVNFIYEMLSKYKAANRVTFELLESEKIKNYSDVKMFIDKVRTFGAKCAIDDFGSGYSSFEHILKLKTDYIKIDGSIIKNIDTDKDAKSIAKAIVSFANDLGIEVVAEFVHSKEVLQTIKDLGIRYAQGYLISPPKPDVA